MKSNTVKGIVLCCIFLLGMCIAQIVPGARRGGLLPAPTSQPGPTQDPTASAVDFGTMDVPESPASGAFGINDLGQIVGAYGPDLGPDIGDAGFMLSKGSFKAVHFPGALRTQCFRINKLGVVVGSYEDSAGNVHAYKLEKGTYSNIDFPGFNSGQGGDINDSGEIVGTYYDEQGNAYGFILIGNTYSSFSAPGSHYTFALGLNNSGEIAGFYADASEIYHGFTLANATFTTVDYPGAPWSGLWKVSDSGVVVGAYGDGNYPDTFEHGFAAKNGEYLNIDVPFVGAQATWVTGINKSGQIVGLYIDTAQRYYGFTARIAR